LIASEAQALVFRSTVEIEAIEGGAAAPLQGVCAEKYNCHEITFLMLKKLLERTPGANHLLVNHLW
jgi:hypothetical protein